ncbi:TlpA family protein disulfide reductase [Nostoc sp. CHAB 5834]|nr:TlpA family protein disulfide reductase [Nostoc sp. CHAB 5834]
MKTNITLKWLIFALWLGSCAPKNGEPIVEPKAILKDLTSFLDYRQKYVRLYEDYKAFNETSKPITRAHFLQQIATGQYLPIRLKAEETTRVYQLYKIAQGGDKDIKTTLQYWGADEYDHFQAEGKPLPDYQFVDMDGKRYSKQTMKGKILVLKCWFVHCVACVREMPALNELKEQYKNRNDIVFVSLCLDSPEKVAAFLKKQKFDYATVPGQTSYLEKSLKLTSFPTHFVVNKQGLVIKKASEYQGVVYALKKGL